MFPLQTRMQRKENYKVILTKSIGTVNHELLVTFKTSSNNVTTLLELQLPKKTIENPHA